MNLEELKRDYERRVKLTGFCSPEITSYVDALQNDNIAYGMVCQHLRLEMGLDPTKEDLSECLVKFKALEAECERLRGALVFIRDECDWEPSTGTGDSRIGECCNDALSKAKEGA